MMKSRSAMLPFVMSLQWAVVFGTGEGHTRDLDAFVPPTAVRIRAQSTNRTLTIGSTKATSVNLTAGRIIGGKASKTEYTSFGFSVGQFLCGGTLIHDDILLTAAHCEGVFSDGVYIGGTEIDGSESVELVVTNEVPHEQFVEETYENDIMIVKLGSAPPAASFQQLNIDDERPKTGESLKAIGFGYTREIGSVSSILREVKLDIVSYEACDDYYGTILEKSMVCTQTDLKDTCLGDSGGPLLDDDGIQIAITSFGRGCARQGVPGVYTRVAAYEKWIMSKICAYSNYPADHCEYPTINTSASPSSNPSSTAHPSGISSSEPTSQPSDAPTVGPPSQNPSSPPTIQPTVTASTVEEDLDTTAGKKRQCGKRDGDENNPFSLIRRLMCAFNIGL